MKVYYELEIVFNEVNYESIYNTLYMFNITSILEENGKIIVSFPENDTEKLVQVKVFLINNNIAANNNINVSKLDNLDWNKEWEKTIEPVNIKNKIIIYPSWKKNEIKKFGEKIFIEIDPKMSFGTGHNETTQLILELMCGYIGENDKTMLDFGCGTGVLSIASIKLGLTYAIAIDIDEDSIENAREYIILNNVQDKITLYQSDINEVHDTNFDIICANITSSVIIPNLISIYNKLRPNGKLFITGVLTDEINEVKGALIKNKFDIKETRSKAEWSGMYAIKN
ncbi:MAG TPA: 50S ribosomal protein L11 methyltransferase [Ignavibacteria bacterium]|nr:50S ribosomal protein L11 methyltransferase [Ignavibacteria bacterium]